MSRKQLSLSPEKISPFDLEAFMKKATELNRKTLEIFTTPFPKASSRWLSYYQFRPRPIELTSEGEVEGGLSWLISSVIDLSFTRSLFSPYYSNEGGRCYDPASSFFLELASTVDSSPDYADFCKDLRQQDKGRRYREIAGLGDFIPGEDDMSNFRRRVGSEPLESLMAIFVNLFRELGLIKDELLSTDGQLEPSYARFKGCAFFCQGCQQFPLDEASRQELGLQLQAGAKRLQILCPFPEVRAKVLAATTKPVLSPVEGKGEPREPKVALLEVELLPADRSKSPGRQRLAQLLGLPEDELPPLRIKWSYLRKGPQGELLGSCPKLPSDLEARVGYHVDNKNPQKKELVLGYLQERTTSINVGLGLELPTGNSTYPADVREGECFQEHRSRMAIPLHPGQIQLGDSAYDAIKNYRWTRSWGGIALFDYNPRNEKLSPQALLKRGYDKNGTPYAPCGRLCRSNGYNHQTDSRQYVCGLQCPPEERKPCPHGQKVRGYSQRMSFADYPRLIGPIQRGSEEWEALYAVRTASERTNSYDQEVIEKGRPPRMRGLKAFRSFDRLRTGSLEPSGPWPTCCAEPSTSSWMSLTRWESCCREKPKGTHV